MGCLQHMKNWLKVEATRWVSVLSAFGSSFSSGETSLCTSIDQTVASLRRGGARWSGPGWIRGGSLGSARAADGSSSSVLSEPVWKGRNDRQNSRQRVPDTREGWCALLGTRKSIVHHHRICYVKDMQPISDPVNNPRSFMATKWVLPSRLWPV